MYNTGSSFSSKADLHTPLLLQPNQIDDSSPSVVFLDSTWFMPNVLRKGREEFISRRLPKARFIDLDEVADSHELGLKHMMPSPDVFAKACGEWCFEYYFTADLLSL